MAATWAAAGLPAALVFRGVSRPLSGLPDALPRRSESSGVQVAKCLRLHRPGANKKSANAGLSFEYRYPDSNREERRCLEPDRSLYAGSQTAQTRSDPL